MRDMSSEVMWLGFGACLFTGLVFWGYISGLRWNLTDSVPRGIYRRTHESLISGRLVAFCLPPETAQFGYQRGYIAKVPDWPWARECPDGYQALLKPIAATSSDVVELGIMGVWINGEYVSMSYSRPWDSAERPLPQLPYGRVTLAPGELWVMSTHHANSWDSRYFGPIREESVVATAQPVWVWK